MDDQQCPSNWKRPRESNYAVDNDNSDAKSQPNIKKPKPYVIVLDEEEEPGEPEDD